MTTVYAIGSNGSGQLGIGHAQDVSVPKEVLLDDSIIAAGPVTIRAGGNHTLLLTSAGQLLSAGDASNGARGAEFQSSGDFPDTRFSAVLLANGDPTGERQFKVSHCAATWEASIIVVRDDDGRATRVYSLGTGNKGELGLGDFIFRTGKPERIADFPPPGTEVTDVAACVSHVVVVLDNGDVYGWGSGRKGELGLPEAIVKSPRKICDVGFPVTRAVCGRDFTFLLGKRGTEDHLLLGFNKWDIRSSLPAHVSGWKDVGAGWGHVVLLMDNGAIISAGRNDHGQCAPPGLPEVSKMAVGSEHVLALSTDGDVMAWGWGEHGNCGPKTTDGDVKGTWNIVASTRHLPEGSKILSIGCGCATSWICVANP